MNLTADTALSVWSVIFRLFLALVIGGIIGLERETKNQAAGFRTYMLVCMGAAMVMMTNQYICNIFASGDPSRLGAQVVSGIGFLGAGSILVTGNHKIKGLTTAAGLWSSACLGLAVGIGFYVGAIAGAVTVFLIMTIFQRLDVYMHERSHHMNLYINFKDNDALNEFLERCKYAAIKVMNLQITKTSESRQSELTVMVTLKLLGEKKHTEVISKLSNVNGLKHIEEI